MLYSQLDPDFIVTIDGSPIKTDDIIMWTVTDDEEQASAITVDVDNNDFRYSGKAKIGAKLAIRFGYVGYLVGKAEFPIMAYKEHYTTSGGCTVTFEGKDPTQKGGGNKGSGNHKSTDPAEVAKNVHDDPGIETTKAEKPTDEDGEAAKIARMNESKIQLLAKLYPFFSKKGNPSEATDVIPEDPAPHKDFTGKEDKGDTSSGTGSKADAARGKDSGGKGGQDPVTASLTLIGYPQLKAKANITIANVGPDASGTYYVKQCKHSIARGGGNFTTTASLIRGGIGKGGSGPTNGCAPTVNYSNIYGKGGYIGPRKYDEESQDTLIFGSGGPVISFDMTVNPQQNRGGGKDKGKGKGHDINKRLKPVSSDDPGVEGSGGSSANPGK